MPGTDSPSPLDFSARIPELDGLRGLAILLVLIWHYAVSLLKFQTGLGVTLFRAAGRLSWSGVDLFFVLSGFLIGGILLDARDSPQYFKVFYIRRFCRIIPIYAVVCLLFWMGSSLSLAAHLPSRIWTFAFPMPWYSYATFTQNFWMGHFDSFGAWGLGATWSLAIEEQFYLTLPLLIRFAPRQRLPNILGWLILCAPLLRSYLTLPYVNGQFGSYVLMPCRADSLLFGALAAALLRDPGIRAHLARPESQSRYRRTLNLIFFVLFFGVAFLTIMKWTVFSTPMIIPGYTWLAMFYLSLLLIGVTQKDHLFSRLLRFRPLRSLGGIAYGTYLFHLPVLGVCFALLRRESPVILNFADAAVTLLALALTLALAIISWRFFEKPIVNLSHAYKYYNSSPN